MKKKFILSVMAISFLALGSLFIQGTPKVGSFSSLTQIKEGFLQEEHLSISLKALSAEESQKYLSRDLLDWGMQPVQVTVVNQTPDPYKFSPDSIDLPLLEAKSISKQILKEAIPRSIGLKIASFIFWPLTIPSTIDSIMTLKSHNKLKRSLSSKAVKEEMIAPYSVVNRIFFIRTEDYKGVFTITLENQETLVSETFEVASSSETQTLNPIPSDPENYYVTHG